MSLISKIDTGKMTVLPLLFLVFATEAFGDNRCFTGDEAQKIIAAFSSPGARAEDKKLRKELIEMRDERSKLNEKITTDTEKNKGLIPVSNQLAEKQLLRVCQILKQSGLPTKETVQEDGFDAFTFLIANNKAFALQRELLPVLTEAAKKGLIQYPLIASLVDNIRVGAGYPQIFGTQATIKENIIYVYPLLNDEKVDEWRKEYQLPPLAVQIRRLENQYMMPVLKSQRRISAAETNAKAADQKSDAAILGLPIDENEAIKVETKLVNLNVRVMTRDAKVPSGLNLSKNDFQILEDGVDQEISFFTTTEEPFDLVLLLDFSGSTREKRGLIKKAAQRFVEFARPNDRIAVVAFATETKLISTLTTDKAALAKRIDAINLEGGSPIWDSLKFTYDNILSKESVGRRSAVVIMSDGLDNSRNITFADVMETVRRGDSTIFSIYLNTTPGNFSSGWLDRMAKRSQEFMSMLAEESGGQFYKAKGINDLNGIYEQVVNDLGKVFSVGFEPKNDKRDGGWRELSVKIKTQPNLVAKTRRGYYAN
ncbi:MAG: VWA domain-containing protein [Pyrinomonadaceae bacterium]